MRSKKIRTHRILYCNIFLIHIMATLTIIRTNIICSTLQAKGQR